MKVIVGIDPACGPDAGAEVMMWQCDDCKQTGVIDVSRIDTWRVMHAAEDSHKQVSPDCPSIRIFPANRAIAQAHNFGVVYGRGTQYNSRWPSYMRGKSREQKWKEALIAADRIMTRHDAGHLMQDLIRGISKTGGERQRTEGVDMLLRAIRYLLRTAGE